MYPGKYFGEGAPAPVYPTLDAYGDYTDLAVVHNPASKRSGEVDDVLHALAAARSVHGLEVHKLATSLDLAENTAMLQELPASTIIGIWSGDGGTSKVLGPAHDLQLPNPIVILPGGTKNDLALQAAPPELLAEPATLLRQANVGSVAPVEISIWPGDLSKPVESHKAFAYASHGVSGAVAHTVNTPEYRQRAVRRGQAATYLAERGIATRAFLGAEPFYANKRRSIDLIVANGSRMAGGSMKPAADLFRPEARLITVRNRLVGAGVLGALCVGGRPSRWVGDTFDITTPQTIDISNERPMYFQVDGDEFRLDGTATLHFQVAAYGLNIVTSRQR